MVEERIEIRGILRKDIAIYLQQLGAKAADEEQFIADKWSCQVYPEEKFFMFQSWIPKVHLQFCANDESILKTVLSNFRKKTFRAGG